MKKTTLFIALVALLVSFSQLTYGGTTPETDKNLSSVQEDEDNTRKNNRRRFTPHWSSFEIGLNNYMTSDYSTSLPDNLSFMDINTSKSFNVNINFGQIGIGLTRHLGFVTGVGLEFNNYRFDGNNNIMKNDLGVIIEYDAGADGLDLEKSKLATTYFVMPLLIEAQLPVSRRNTINIAARGQIVEFILWIIQLLIAQLQLITKAGIRD